MHEAASRGARAAPGMAQEALGSSCKAPRSSRLLQEANARMREQGVLLRGTKAVRGSRALVTTTMRAYLQKARVRLRNPEGS